MKPNRLSVVEKIQAKQAASDPMMDIRHIGNLCVGARRGLPSLTGADMVNVATSLALVEEWLSKASKPAEGQQAEQPAPQAQQAKASD